MACFSQFTEHFDSSLGMYNVTNSNTVHLVSDGDQFPGCAEQSAAEFQAASMTQTTPVVPNVSMTFTTTLDFSYRALGMGVLTGANNGIRAFITDEFSDESRMILVAFNDVVVADTGWVQVSINVNSECSCSTGDLLSFIRFSIDSTSGAGGTPYTVRFDDVCINDQLVPTGDFRHSRAGIPGLII